ncbi:MAG: hypothetical protein JWN44_4426 [Myxococcales bacterium]|nr:hypothetical protein [Myxococcales bacterium]
MRADRSDRLTMIAPRWGLILLLVSPFVGCQRTSPKAALSDDAASKVAITQQIGQVLAESAAVRGLTVTSTVPVRFLGADPYRQKLGEHAAAEIFGAASDQVASIWVALNFADPGVRPHEIALQIVDEKQNEAFYHQGDNVLYVREPSAKYDATTSAAVVKGLTRFLQVQHSAAPSMGIDLDANMAAFALREGAATATFTAYTAKQKGKPVDDSVAKIAALLDSLPIEALITSTGFAPALRRAPLLLRDALTRANAGGLRLVAALLHTGGFELVNRALAKPPTSMLAVFDPPRYVSGWQPVALSPIDISARRDVTARLRSSRHPRVC